METALSLMVLTAIALLAGAAYLWRRQGAGKQVWLMVILALVMMVNVAIWTLPGTGGEAPISQVSGQDLADDQR